MKFLILAAGLALAATLHAQQIADSECDFSNVQGQGGWYYGFFNATTDTNAAYNPATDFQLMTQFKPTGALGVFGPAWYVQDGAYWAGLWRSGGHPNSAFTSSGRRPENVHVIRRWVSTVSGPTRLIGRVAKAHTGCGDGVHGMLYAGDTLIWQAFVSANDTVGAAFDLNPTLAVGQTVDLVLAPRDSDICDSTHLRLTIGSLRIPGDTDSSGCVDDADLTNLILDFGGAPGSGSGFSTDLNCDGAVDDADLTELILSFGQGC